MLISSSAPRETDLCQPQASVPWCAGVMGAALVAFHLVVNRQYGFHGDELYFIVCGQRPAWGYVDHPPFVPMVARIATDLMGTNLFALRFFPALALGVGCVLTGWLARRLRAGVYGEFLAALTFVCAPLMLRLGAFLNIPAFEVLFWLIAAHLIVTICQRDDPRWWVAVGVVTGVALLNKHTTLFLGTGIAAGLMMTQRRRDLATPWPWIGGAIALTLLLPNLVWQYRNDWATLEFVRTINATIMDEMSRAEFVVYQIILMNLFGAIVWIGGVVFYLRGDSGKPYRMLGWVFLAVTLIMIVLKAKVYYLVPAYPMAMAGGAVLLERATSGRGRIVLRGALVTAIVAMGAVFMPIMAPVGTLAWKEQYIARVLGFVVDDPRDLTFDFHYQHNRVEELDAFSTVYDALSDDEKKGCAILTSEYGSASAVNVLGPALGLPPGISGNNSYYLWGPGEATGQCIIASGYDEEELKRYFGEVRLDAKGLSPLQVGLQPIYRCGNPIAPLDELWPKLKAYR